MNIFEATQVRIPPFNQDCWIFAQIQYLLISFYLQHGDIARCKELVESGFNVNERDNDSVTLMHWAAINNRLELMKYYISKGINVDEPGGELQATPLHWATRYSIVFWYVSACTSGTDVEYVYTGKGT